MDWLRSLAEMSKIESAVEFKCVPERELEFVKPY